MIRRFEKRHGSASEGRERCTVFVDDRHRAVEILLYSRTPNTDTIFSQHGLITDRKEGEVIEPFFIFQQEMLEDFPDILVVLYKALQDFFGDSLNTPHPGVQHLSDMRKIVEEKLGVTFND
jgi:hypothetical protein